MNQFKISTEAPLKRLAAPAVVLMGFTVLLSAALRLDPAGGFVPMARMAHRLVATGVLLLVVAMVVKARRTTDSAARRHSLTLLALVIALSVLGVVTPRLQSPLVVLGNLLGGYAVFLLCLRLAWQPTAPALPGPALRAALVLTLMQVALGALVGATPSLPPDSLASMLRPAHIVGATATSVAVLALAGHAWHQSLPGWALVLGLPPLAQFTLGARLLGLDPPIAPALLHNLLALTLLSVLVLLLPRDRASAAS